MSVEFLMIAEAGVLERQALLLCESIRAFGGRHAGAAITVLQPRGERPVGAAGRHGFAALGAKIVELSVVSPCPGYGTSYRILACAEYEPAATGDVLVFLDSDMVFVAEPDLDLQDADWAARPVDVKGMCTAGEGDPNDVYWRELCRVCEVDYDRLPFVVSTVDRVRVKASYNGGLTVVKSRAGLFRKTEDFFGRSLRAGLVPRPKETKGFQAGHGLVTAEGGRLWGSAQAALSLAALALGMRVRILPASLNFPLHMHAALKDATEARGFPPVSLVHYHDVFRNGTDRNPIFWPGSGYSAEAKDWLLKRRLRFA